MILKNVNAYEKSIKTANVKNQYKVYDIKKCINICDEKSIKTSNVKNQYKNL